VKAVLGNPLERTKTSRDKSSGFCRISNVSDCQVMLPDHNSERARFSFVICLLLVTLIPEMFSDVCS
jgi:hypothetical protein